MSYTLPVSDFVVTIHVCPGRAIISSLRYFLMYEAVLGSPRLLPTFPHLARTVRLCEVHIIPPYEFYSVASPQGQHLYTSFSVRRATGTPFAACDSHNSMIFLTSVLFPPPPPPPCSPVDIM